MISTVTTTTVTTVTTMALTGTFALVCVFLLLTLVIQKELTSTTRDRRLLKLGKALTIGIVPLLIAFALIVATKVADVIR